MQQGKVLLGTAIIGVAGFISGWLFSHPYLRWQLSNSREDVIEMTAAYSEATARAHKAEGSAKAAQQTAAACNDARKNDSRELTNSSAQIAQRSAEIDQLLTRIDVMTASQQSLQKRVARQHAALTACKESQSPISSVTP